MCLRRWHRVSLLDNCGRVLACAEAVSSPLLAKLAHGLSRPCSHGHLRHNSRFKRFAFDHRRGRQRAPELGVGVLAPHPPCCYLDDWNGGPQPRDRKSTRLNSSHVKISYAVFCLKKKKK